MDNTDEDLSGLKELHTTKGDASEAIAAFIEAGHSGEVPIDTLMQAAEKSLQNLTKWRPGLKSGLIQVGVQRHWLVVATGYRTTMLREAKCERDTVNE